MSSKMNKPAIAFFGTSLFSTIVLDELKSADMTPDLIIATPDKPQGRKLVLTPPPAKVWAEKNNVHIIQPMKLRDGALLEELKKIRPEGWDIFIVASYGKIIPKEIIDLPKYKTLNVHPSLLPKLRGASPIQSAILLDEKETGVTIIRLDDEMDHGPILAQEKVTIPNWPPTTNELKHVLGHAGGKMLAALIPNWIAGTVDEVPQDHSQATYTKKIEKSDGLIELADDSYNNFLKIQAFSEWPTAYFFISKNGARIRVIIKKAEFKDGKLEILRVVPEGKSEMDYADFARGYLK